MLPLRISSADDYSPFGLDMPRMVDQSGSYAHREAPKTHLTSPHLGCLAGDRRNGGFRSLASSDFYTLSPRYLLPKHFNDVPIDSLLPLIYNDTFIVAS